MSFEGIIKTDAKRGINTGQYKHNFKDRVHMSKSKMDMYSDAVYLDIDSSEHIEYDRIKPKYIAATNITYDIIVSIFDVNTRDLVVCRAFEDWDKTRKTLEDFARTKEKGRPNLEARVIGMQNKEEGYADVLGWLADFFEKNSIKLVEVDMFGDNIRHVAIDAKLGTSYDVLLENRLYRPGELKNSITMENLKKSLMDKNAGQSTDKTE